jgi:hypothetical protein
VRRPRVDVLYFEGCSNHGLARALVERVAAELQVKPELRLVKVPDADGALKLRFLGSPTIRVDGRDVEPGADEREDFAFACRVYRGEHDFARQPDEAWIREALAAAAR